MKTIRDSHIPEYGHLHVPDRVKAVIDLLVGQKGNINLLARVRERNGARKFFCYIHGENGMLFSMSIYGTRGEVARELTRWVDAGCPERIGGG